MLSHAIKTFIAHETIPAGARVKLVAGSASRVELAGATDTEIGTAILHLGKLSYAANSEVGVKLSYSDGTRTLIADAGGIAEGAILYRAASGKVSASGTEIFGICLEASVEADDKIEGFFLPA